MAGFEVKREDASGKITLRLNGTLDGQAARQVQLLISEVDREVDRATTLTLDFSQVRDFHDYSVGVLGHVLRARPVELVGLRTHHARMFEYFGIHTEGGTERAYYTPEELLGQIRELLGG